MERCMVSTAEGCIYGLLVEKDAILNQLRVIPRRSILNVLVSTGLTKNPAMTSVKRSERDLLNIYVIKCQYMVPDVLEAYICIIEGPKGSRQLHKLDFDDTYSILLYGTGALVALWLSSAVVGALDSIPLGMHLKLEYMLKMLLEVFFLQPCIIIRQFLFPPQVAGLPTNISFLQSLGNHWAFEKGLVGTHFIEHFKNDLFVDSTDELAKETYDAATFGAKLVAACLCELDLVTSMETFGGNNLLSLWYSPPPFRMHHSSKRVMELEWEKKSSGSFQEPFKLAITHRTTGSYFTKANDVGSQAQQ